MLTVPASGLFEGTAAREHRTDLSHQTAQMRRAGGGDAERHLRRANGNDDVARRVPVEDLRHAVTPVSDVAVERH